MAKESEKRFEAVMDKLFKTPQKSKPNASSSVVTGAYGVQLSQGKKRTNMSPGLALIGAKSRNIAADNWQTSSTSSDSVQASSCRPWDRDDLGRRLATFKSMTWFAKPQAVSGLNCAMKGWINIDIDTIACQSCGARLLFSTPSSWSRQQVEKAALVFSLKLDSGHKSLCPWVDNSCDESLAQFPHKPTALLVEDYKDRFSSLLQLSALPLISPMSIHCLKNSQLEEFLKGSPVEENNDPSGGGLISGQQSASPNSYYQAQKLISLCGWEPRSLPYIVDRKVQQECSSEDVHLANKSSPSSNGLGLSVICSPCPDGSNETDNESQVSASLDPNSVVLHCSLCSATVGLWTFSLVQRPVEFLRLVGYTEVNDKSDSGQSEDDGKHVTDGVAKTNFSASISLHENNVLNFTIAGGPPPVKQNYRAKISLPLIGRSLRARVFADSSVGKEPNLSLAEANIPREGTDQIGAQDSTIGNTMQDMQVVPLESKNDDKLEADDSAKSYKVQVSESMSTSTEDNITVDVNDKTGKIVEAAHVKQGDKQHDNLTESCVQLVAENIYPGKLGKSSEQASSQKSMEFDPIKQHRVFCPWIALNAKSAPGWQQTLSALQRHKEISLPMPENTPSVEVDDPIASVKKLFSSPPRKRAKR